MALTNFNKLTDEQKTVWSRDVWKAARDAMFLNNFVGGSDAMVHRITELTKTEKGSRAVITLVTDLEGDGVAGNRQLEGNEEDLKAYDQVIQLDQLRHANRSEGRMADQKTVVQFRGQSKDKLAYWLANRVDQLGILTATGVSYAFHTNGAPRMAGSHFPLLEFSADVTAPTANRHRRWDVVDGLVAANTADVAVADTPSWKMLVEAKAYAVENFIRPIRTKSGIECYNVFMTPRGISKLKQDADFLAAWQHAQKRGEENPLFKGTPHGGTNGFFVDGLNIMEYRHVYNTLGAASGSKWGAGSAIDGQAVLFCGAQALGLADIGLPMWVEKDFDYDNSPGISVAKIFGLLKPVFRSIHNKSDEDFGVLRIDTAI